MSSYPPKNKTFLVTVHVLPQKEGVDLPSVIQKLANLLADYSTATRVLYKFKVSGESKILSVIQVLNIIGLERTLGGLSRLGGVEVECSPIITYEKFGRNLEVAKHLTEPSTGSLAKESLYWLEFHVGYMGKSTDELIKLWRKECETILTSRQKGEMSVELFKNLAERKVQCFINAAEPEYLDWIMFQLPIMAENGSNVTIKARAVQFLDDYVSRISTESM